MAVDAAGPRHRDGQDLLQRLPHHPRRIRHETTTAIATPSWCGSTLPAARSTTPPSSAEVGGTMGYAMARGRRGSAAVTGGTGSRVFLDHPWHLRHAAVDGGYRRLRGAAQRRRQRPRLRHLPRRERLRTQATALALDAAGHATVTGETFVQRLPEHPRRLRHELQRRDVWTAFRRCRAAQRCWQRPRLR